MEAGEDESLMLELKEVVESASEEMLMFHVLDIIEGAEEKTRQALIDEMRQLFDNISRIKELSQGRIAGHTSVITTEGNTLITIDREVNHVQSMIIRHRLEIKWLEAQYMFLHNLGIEPAPTIKPARE